MILNCKNKYGKKGKAYSGIVSSTYSIAFLGTNFWTQSENQIISKVKYVNYKPVWYTMIELVAHSGSWNPSPWLWEGGQFGAAGHTNNYEYERILILRVILKASLEFVVFYDIYTCYFSQPNHAILLRYYLEMSYNSDFSFKPKTPTASFMSETKQLNLVGIRDR
jgi:hypothetical protein